MNKAVGVLHDENDFIVFLMVTSEERKLQAFVAMNDDSDTFLTAADAAVWERCGSLRRFRTTGLTAEQKSILRTGFVEQQIARFREQYHPLELATNKSLAARLIFSLFGKGWGIGWKKEARTAGERVGPADNPAFQFLLERFPELETARLGALYLARKHGLDLYSRDEMEAIAMAKVFSREDGPTPYYGERLTPTLPRFGMSKAPAEALPTNYSNSKDLFDRGSRLDITKKRK